MADENPQLSQKSVLQSLKDHIISLLFTNHLGLNIGTLQQPKPPQIDDCIHRNCILMNKPHVPLSVCSKEYKPCCNLSDNEFNIKKISDKDDCGNNINYSWCNYSCKRSQYIQTCNQEDSYTTVDSSRLNNENKMKNMKIQLENYKQRVECMLKMNQQIQSELNKSIQNNLLIEQCITCPYVVNNKGKVKFPGKNDLDKRFDILFNELENIRNDLKTVQNDNDLVCKLDKITHLPLPRCPSDCNKNVNENVVTCTK